MKVKVSNKKELEASLIDKEAIKDDLPVGIADDAILVSIKGGPESGYHGHAGRPGIVGGSQAVRGALLKVERAKKDWILNQTFAKRTMEREQDLYAGNFASEDKQNGCMKVVASTLDGIVPVAHFDHLKQMLFYTATKELQREGHKFLHSGSYNVDKQVLRVVDRCVQDVGTLVHEIGHHVSMYLNYDITMFASDALQKWKDRLGGGAWQLGIDIGSIEDYGITYHGTTNQYEFAADTYKTWLLGKAIDVRNNLASLYKRTLARGVNDRVYYSLDDLFTRTDVGNYIKK